MIEAVSKLRTIGPIGRMDEKAFWLELRMRKTVN